MLNQAYWEREDPNDAAQALMSTTAAIQRFQSNRLIRARQNNSIYERRYLSMLHPSAYMTMPEPGDLGGSVPALDLQPIPMARNLVNAVVAKVAGKQKPKSSFCVNNSDWRTKRRALKLERFVEAVMSGRQARKNDAWEVAIQAFRDACITDWGVVKIYADTIEKRIRVERRLPWEVFFDPAEMKHGDPQSIFDIYGADKHRLAALYPKHADEIMMLPPLSSQSLGVEDNVAFGEEAARQVRVVEAYRLRIGEDKPGRHIVAVGSTSGATDLLDGEGEWDRNDFPYVMFTWEPWIVGEYGTSIIDNVKEMVGELNMAVDRWREAERLLSGGFVTVEQDSVDEKLLQSNEIGNIIPYRKGSQPPVVTAPNTLGETSQKWLQVIKGLCYECSGISQMSATGERPAGVDAAVAMRTLENMATERFAIPWRAYELGVSVGFTRLILAAAKEIAEEDAEFAATWVHDSEARQLRWSDVEVDLPDEAIQVYSVSGLVNTPTDRLQLASELYDRQLISAETYREVIQVKGVAAELEQGNEAAKWLDKQIENWLDYIEGEFDEQSDPPFRFKPPLKFIGIDGLTDQLLRVGRAYMKADMDDAPGECLQWFIRFMTECDAAIQRLQERQALMQAAAAGKSSAALGMQGQAPAPQGAA